REDVTPFDLTGGIENLLKVQLLHFPQILDSCYYVQIRFGQCSLAFFRRKILRQGELRLLSGLPRLSSQKIQCQLRKVSLKNINLGGCHLDFNLNPKGFPGIASKRRVIDLSGYSEKLELRGN